MYIAFKWLFFISMTMWISMCCLDHFILKKIRRLEKFTMSEFAEVPAKNQTQFAPAFRRVSNENHVVYYYAMFVAGGLAVALFNNKARIFYYSKKKIIQLKIPDYEKKLRVTLIDLLNIPWQLCTVSNITAAINCVANNYHLQLFWQYFKQRFRIIYFGIPKQSDMEITGKYDERFVLDQKLKLVLDERKGLVKVLTDVMRENSTIKGKFHLVIMAKDRLVKRIEEYERNLRNIRAQQNNFQYLYIATCQKNIFLRALVDKLSQEKRRAEQNLIELVNEVRSSKNSQLIDYCSKLIVGSATAIMKKDINAEVRRFLENSSTNQLSIEAPSTSTNVATADTAKIVKAQQESPIYSKHRVAGTKGGYIVTVKDREGLIEKMYEYNSSGSDTGDTIKSIRREYSVFHDRDCIVEFKFPTSDGAPSCSTTSTTRFTPRRHFLTQSEAFQNFMKTSNNQIAQRRRRSLHHFNHHYDDSSHWHCAVNAY